MVVVVVVVVVALLVIFVEEVIMRNDGDVSDVPLRDQSHKAGTIEKSTAAFTYRE